MNTTRPTPSKDEIALLPEFPRLGLDRITLATEVDHVIPQAEGGSEDESNLQAICTDCHKAKTQAEAARGVKRMRFHDNHRGGGSKV